MVGKPVCCEPRARGTQGALRVDLGTRRTHRQGTHEARRALIPESWRGELLRFDGRALTVEGVGSSGQSSRSLYALGQPLTNSSRAQLVDRSYTAVGELSVRLAVARPARVLVFQARSVSAA